MQLNPTTAKMSATLAIVLAAWTFYPVVYGQVIFDGLTGETLLDSLRAAYTPSIVETFENAEDLIFDVIYRDNDGASDGVYCVYTGFFVPFDGIPNDDPSQDLINVPFQDSLGLSIEHTWPQSKGAGAGNAQVNMHHLFPAKRDVNWARASFPFGDIADSETNVWYRLGMSSVTIPTQNLDEYSELLNDQLFEPREDDKGNVARAMFYFYTIYRNEADAADPAFFNLQKNTLRDWHFADPPDPDEAARSNAIATYQSGMINPFVQDITLVDRAYFEPELPVSLIEFDIQINEPDIRVSWRTASERNNAYFTVSLNRSHGTTRTKTIAAAGDFDGAGQSYEHTFREHQAGATEIVLTQTDITGATFELSRRSLHLTGTGRGYVYPNPVEGLISIVVPGMDERTKPLVQVFDGAGRLLRLDISVIDAGLGLEISIDASSLATGTYFVRIGNTIPIATKSFVVWR